MELHKTLRNAPPLLLPFLRFNVPAGFQSPATDYIETRIDLNKALIKHPSFTYIVSAEGDSMNPLIKDGNMLIVDRKLEPQNGDVVLASVNKEFCVKRLYKYPDGSIELRPDNPAFPSVHLTSEFDGEFEIFGRVIKAIQDLEK